MHVFKLVIDLHLQALRESQLEVTRLTMELRDARAQVQELTGKLQYKKIKLVKGTAGSSAAAGVPASASDDSETTRWIGVYAQKFGVMNEIIISSNAFPKPRPKGVNSDDPDRWKSAESAFKGLIAELYEELPLDMHLMLQKHPSFCDVVCI